jgi:hypothetical protein
MAQLTFTHDQSSVLSEELEAADAKEGKSPNGHTKGRRRMKFFIFDLNLLVDHLQVQGKES